LIDRAEHEINMAAYVLTDWPVMQALTRAADRGVKVRIYLDGAQLAEREPAKVFFDLAETPGVEIRIKHETSAPMHLKSYQIDGRLLRTGAANFSASGLKRQDNDLIVIESAGAAASFKRNFDAWFAPGEALSAGSRWPYDRDTATVRQESQRKTVGLAKAGRPTKIGVSKTPNITLAEVGIDKNFKSLAGRECERIIKRAHRGTALRARRCGASLAWHFEDLTFGILDRQTMVFFCIFSFFAR
jgi:hypothetical protein